jgi:hypothetical protein
MATNTAPRETRKMPHMGLFVSGTWNVSFMTQASIMAQKKRRSDQAEAGDCGGSGGVTDTSPLLVVFPYHDF